MNVNNFKPFVRPAVKAPESKAIGVFFTAMQNFREARAQFHSGEIDISVFREAARVLVNNSGAFQQIQVVYGSVKEASKVTTLAKWSSVAFLAMGILFAFAKEKALQIFGMVLGALAISIGVALKYVKPHECRLDEMHNEMEKDISEAKRILSSP